MANSWYMFLFVVIRCPLLSHVVSCCPMLFDFFTYNYHELTTNFCAHQFMTNYMVIICSFHVVQLLFFASQINFSFLFSAL